jgi:hypothetical protein
MAGIRVSIFARDGIQLVDIQVGAIPHDTEIDFRSILSILNPMSISGNPFLFTMTLGLFHIDICYDNDRFIFSIIPSTTKPDLISVNPIFAWAANLAFSQLLSDQSQTEPVSQQTSDTFFSMIPRNPLEAVHRAISRLQMAGVNYIAFIAQGHRVFLSLGETKMAPQQFIFAWCALLEAIGQLDEQTVVAVPEYENLIVCKFVPFMKMAVFFIEKATQARVQGFLDEMERVKVALVGLFVARELRPQMPQTPKEGGRPRRPGMPRPLCIFFD